MSSHRSHADWSSSTVHHDYNLVPCKQLDTVVEDQWRPCEPGKGIMTCDRFHVVGNVGVVLAFVLCSPAFAQVTDPQKLLAEADRLAWLRVWTRAEPIYAQARQAFVRQDDRRNALYAEVSQLRGKLPTLPVPEVSERLSAYLDDPPRWTVKSRN